jgi:hypothetical protein
MKGVTETQAKAVLAKLRPWLQEEPPLDQFRKQLEVMVARTEASPQATIHGGVLAQASSQVGQPVLSNPPAWGTLIAANAPERVMSMVLEPQRPRKGPAPRAWYSGFVRDLAKIAEGIGIKVTTAGDRSGDPHATPFTRFAFAAEKLLPLEEQSPSLAACAKRIDRAIAVSSREIDGLIVRRGKRGRPADSQKHDK